MRLIDADALMKDITHSLNQMTDIGIAVDGDWLWAKLNDAIDNAPTIEERKKGKWICEIGYSKCSICGNLSTADYNFCPSCGADMRGGDDEADRC